MKICFRKIIIVFLLLFVFSSIIIKSSNADTVAIVYIEGTINEGTVYLVKKATETANQGTLILIINSYGGYVYSMDRVVDAIMTCNCKTIAWIPPGAKAVSAASIIALSAKKLYVGEGAVLGACEPYPPDEKVESYIVTKIKALLSKKEVENPEELAEKMVRKNYVMDFNEMLEKGVANGKATTLNDIFEKEGLKDKTIVVIEKDIITEVLQLLFDPGMAFMFIVLGILLILLEVKVTGFQGWGIIGGVFIALAFYTLDLIGINILTLTLLALGLFSLILELKKPGIQVFGLTGLVLIILAVILEYYNRPYITFTVNIIPILISLGILAGFLFFIIAKASETFKIKTPTLEEKIVGKEGHAKTDIEPGKTGIVYVENEDWSATSNKFIKKGERVRVVKIEGLKLYVEPIE